MQIFFVSPTGYLAVRNALKGIPGQHTHGWCADGDDPSKDSIIGVAEIEPQGDGECVASALEAAGIHVLPDHRFGEKLTAAQVAALSKHGVIAGDTTPTAMQKIHAVSGFAPHKVKRFS